MDTVNRSARISGSHSGGRPTTTYESEPKSKGELIAVMASVARAVSGKGKQGLVRIHSSLVGSGGVGTPAGPEMKRKCKEILFLQTILGEATKSSLA